jgi:hypothetical protein
MIASETARPNWSGKTGEKIARAHKHNAVARAKAAAVNTLRCNTKTAKAATAHGNKARPATIGDTPNQICD